MIRNLLSFTLCLLVLTAIAWAWAFSDIHGVPL